MTSRKFQAFGISIILVGVFLFPGCLPQPDVHQDDDDQGVSTGSMMTIAGTGQAGFSGDGALATTAQLDSPVGVIERPSGEIIIADFDNHRVRSIDPSTGIITTLAGTGLSTGDGALNRPTEVLFTSDGAFLVAAWGEHRIYRYPATGTREVVAGNGAAECAANEPSTPASAAAIHFPRSLGVLGNGSLVFAEQGCNRLRQVTEQAILGTFAGTGNPGYSGDEGLALVAEFHAAQGVPSFPAFGMSLSPEEIPDELYVADTENHVIREINLRNGNIETFAGTGSPGFTDGPLTQATFNRPTNVFVGSDHAIWVVDGGNHAIRRIDSLGTGVATVAGTGTAGFNGDNLPALQTQLNDPSDVFVTQNGDVLIADSGNHRIRRMSIAP
ncbi:MAG: hypothetical protein AABZ47_13815 [Planctomycetota bacterium]